MTKAVIFDMFETLITQFDQPSYFGQQMAEDAQINYDQFIELWHATENERTLGLLTLEDVIADILKSCDCYTDAKFELIISKRKTHKKECFRHLHKNLIPMLQGLKDKGIKIGLISNCYSEEAKIIRESVLAEFFDDVCLSYEEHIQKPDLEIYRHMMTKLGVDADECLYLGDGGSNELDAATEIGMRALQAAWYQKPGHPYQIGILENYVSLMDPMEVLSYL